MLAAPGTISTEALRDGMNDEIQWRFFILFVWIHQKRGTITSIELILNFNALDRIFLCILLN